MNRLISGKPNHISVSCKLSSFPHIRTASGSSGSQGGPNALLPAPCEMNWFPWRSEPKSYVLLRTSRLSPVLRMSVEGQTAHRCGPGPLHRREFHQISWFESSVTKSRREDRGRVLPAREMPAFRALASSIPQTPCTRREAVHPERVIPKAQGHLIGREGALSQEAPCTKRSPCPTVQMLGEGNIRGSGTVRGAGMSGRGRPVSQSQSLVAYCQEEWSAHTPHVLVRSVNALTGCTQRRWQARVNTSWTGRKPSATGISVSFKAVSVLRAAQALEGHNTCFSWSPSSHPTSLAQTVEQDPVTDIWDKDAQQNNTLLASHSLHSFLRGQLRDRLNTSAQQLLKTKTQNISKALIFTKENVQQRYCFHC